MVYDAWCMVYGIMWTMYGGYCPMYVASVMWCDGWSGPFVIWRVMYVVWCMVYVVW